MLNIKKHNYFSRWLKEATVESCIYRQQPLDKTEIQPTEIISL